MVESGGAVLLRETPGVLCGLENVTTTSVSLTQPLPHPPPRPPLPNLFYSALDQRRSLMNPHALSDPVAPIDVLKFYTLNV